MTSEHHSYDSVITFNFWTEHVGRVLEYIMFVIWDTWAVRFNYELNFALHSFYGFMSVCAYLKLHSFVSIQKILWHCLDIDGAYFGTTFPHLFLMTYGHLKPQKATQSYVPRVFGFKLHKPWHWVASYMRFVWGLPSMTARSLPCVFVESRTDS